MKKLRMIVTSVIVLAIVGGAFAFKVKGGAYCVLNNATTGTDCTTFIQNKQTGATGTVYKYAPFFDGNTTACTAANNHYCTSSGTLQFQAD
jgi:hypothetical protein